MMSSLSLHTKGTRIIYDRRFLLECRRSPVAKTPPQGLPKIPGVTSPSSKDTSDKAHNGELLNNKITDPDSNNTGMLTFQTHIAVVLTLLIIELEIILTIKNTNEVSSLYNCYIYIVTRETLSGWYSIIHPGLVSTGKLHFLFHCKHIPFSSSSLVLLFLIKAAVTVWKTLNAASHLVGCWN